MLVRNGWEEVYETKIGKDYQWKDQDCPNSHESGPRPTKKLCKFEEETFQDESRWFIYVGNIALEMSDAFWEERKIESQVYWPVRYFWETGSQVFKLEFPLELSSIHNVFHVFP